MAKVLRNCAWYAPCRVVPRLLGLKRGNDFRGVEVDEDRHLCNEKAMQHDQHARPVKYRFGAFTLDDGAGLLTREGEEVPLRPKSFESILIQ